MNPQGRSAQETGSRTIDGETNVEERLGEELKDVVSIRGSEETEKPPLDRVFGILKNSRRREVLKYLRRREERVSIGNLAEHIAAIENETTPEMVTSKQRKRVYVALHQFHLPKMDDSEVVDFDNDRGTVELGDDAIEFEAYLKAAHLVKFLRR